MKKRNPLFVAVFPYATFSIGYFFLVVLDALNGETDELNGGQGVVLILFMILIFAGLFYTVYWLVSTARVLRRETSLSIPNSFLIVVPIANYWWMWRYSQSAETYVKNKQQSALIFVLLAALGSIGMGILQDIYNKTELTQAQPHTPEL
jgi:hypothetical protein